MTLVRTSNLGTPFEVQVLFPLAYPIVPPTARLVRPSLRGPHTFPDGTLCVAVLWQGGTSFDSWLAAIDSYIGLYERWRLTGQGWAGEHVPATVSS